MARAFIDLHCHTRASFDCLSKPADVVRLAARRGLTHIAITDHDRIDGALEAQAAAPEGLTVIVGEEVKIQIGTALPLERELTMEVRGRDLIAGLPRTIPITSSEVMEAIEAPLQQLVAAVRSVLEQTPPELSSDIIDKGMVMSGGGSLLRNADKLLTQVTGVPCHVEENSLNCVALGTGLALEHFDFFKKSLVSQI